MSGFHFVGVLCDHKTRNNPHYVFCSKGEAHIEREIDKHLLHTPFVFVEQ